MGMTQYTVARDALRYDLGVEVSEDYAGIIGRASGIQSRLAALSAARQKTCRANVEGLKMAAVIVLRNRFSLTEKEAENQFSIDMNRWDEARAEDAEFDRD